jgi:peptide/nickel transport system permease protein
MVEALRAEHVAAATARGLPGGRVLRRYVLRNSLIATVTVLGVTLGHMIGGSLIVENVFAIPGLGTLIVGAVGSRDFPLIEAGTLLIGVGVVTVSLITDLVNASLDPRTRLQ